MREEIRHMLDSIEAGNAVDAEDALNSIMLQKAGEVMDTMRVDVASNMFNSED